MHSRAPRGEGRLAERDMKRSWLHFLKASEGMAVVEYALLAALLAVAAISGLNMLGAKVNSHYQAISNAMN
ncbi:hypothetical protein CCR94_19900 [Rhodoblastus sphagnicola]|uniref:Flp family type IVb pilin n=2 Tax=Rhodoblastus sphagnicola TaxID=333368 RepID=A0A2S6MYP2_9HYPH|nr:hypothetical protein CCR94_19900 [Rhodoblastus sphagnicola]